MIQKELHTLNRFIHFSFDDVVDSLCRVYKNNLQSIFDDVFFSTIREWHYKYGLSFDMYLFEKTDGFVLEDLPDRYWSELSNNCSWIKLGWHQICAGEISGTSEEQLMSAKRVHEKILEKCSALSWSNTVRLHCFSGNSELLRYLNETGVHTFLTSDRPGVVSYDLGEKECLLIDSQQSYYDEARRVLFRRSDYRLDNIGTCSSVEETIQLLERTVNSYQNCERLYLFCHEWALAEVSEQLDSLFTRIVGLKKNLYINAATCDEGYLYFTSMNTDSLYRVKLQNNELERVAYLPVEKCGFLFSSIQFVEDKLWMIPLESNHIMVWNKKNRLIEVINLPYSVMDGYKAYEHRKAVAFHEYLWIIPTKVKAVVRINTSNYSVRIFDTFPKGVHFGMTGGMPFKNVDLYGDNLYLFADDCSHNLRVDAITGEMEIWNDAFRGQFGTMIDESHALVSPIRDRDKLIIYDSDKGVSREIQLPDYVWSEEKIYAYWYAHRIEDSVWIMPHEAKAILRFECDNDNVQPVVTDEGSYDSLRENSGFSGYDVLDTGEETIITSYMGNQIIRINRKGEIKQVITLRIAFGEYRLRGMSCNSIIMENQNMLLTDYIEYLELGSATYREFSME